MFLSAQTTVLKVKVQTANVRSQPDTGAAVIKQVKLGTLLESKQKVGDWYEISVTNELGVSLTAYINVNVVDVVTGAAPAPVPEEVRPVTPPVAAVQPPRAESPVRDMSYAPVAVNRGGFKLMAAFANASLAVSDNMLDPYDEWKKPLSGFAGGLGFETGGTLGLEIDLMYLPKGIRYKGSDSGVDFDIKFMFTQISVPVLLKFNLPVQGINPYILGGGEIAYVAQAKYTWNVTDGSSSDSGEQDVKEDVNQIDYGLVFGGGIGLPLGGMNLIVEARYHMGMANLGKDPAPGDPTVKSNMFLILAGFKF
ncbi:MAG: outer membrane beta-barrel protein, partial [Candidatus Aminicenantes bacterium]|nr:outer membrane beta-barrel protein [Candidatus Aminicenantes bacterium]